MATQRIRPSSSEARKYITEWLRSTSVAKCERVKHKRDTRGPHRAKAGTFPRTQVLHAALTSFALSPLVFMAAPENTLDTGCSTRRAQMTSALASFEWETSME